MIKKNFRLFGFVRLVYVIRSVKESNIQISKGVD